MPGDRPLLAFISAPPRRAVRPHPPCGLSRISLCLKRPARGQSLDQYKLPTAALVGPRSSDLDISIASLCQVAQPRQIASVARDVLCSPLGARKGASPRRLYPPQDTGEKSFAAVGWSDLARVPLAELPWTLSPFRPCV